MIPRYTRPEMAAIWDPQTRYRIWFEIEAHAADAMAELGIVPKAAAKKIWDKGKKAKFNIARIDPIRVYVSVPEIYASIVHPGTQATLELTSLAGQRFSGSVVRNADSIDPMTRTLLTEVDVPNPNDALRPGMYLQVKFVFSREVFPILIPAAALVVTAAGGQQVGVLDDQHRVQYRAVQLGRDFGAEIEVLSGLTAGETVAVYPGDALPGGTVVEPVTLPASESGLLSK